MESRRRRLASSRMGTALVIASIGVFAVGCFERALQPVNPCTRSRAGNNIRVTSVDDVDLLFMIDNSNSMDQEQAQLTLELPRLVRILASGDRDGDGTPEFQPVRSLHIGVVTSDMGTGGYQAMGCDRGTGGYALGDDGVLITRGRTSLPGCSATYPAIFEFTRDVTNPGTFADDVACVATTGLGGCGFEQQLDAVLKALSPSRPTDWTIPGYVPPSFVNGSLGHGDGANNGFVRQNSALAVILVTDEEDCSASDPALFDSDSDMYRGTTLNLRCFEYPGAQHSIQRYVRGVDGKSGLLGLRQNPNLLIFAGIVGVPPDTVTDPSRIDYEAILAHPDMRETVNAAGTQLEPSCQLTGVGEAYPPRRIVQVAQAIEEAGGSATIQSICQNSYSGALDAIIAKIADALGGACLPRALNPDAEGNVQCDVFEIMPATGDDTECVGLPGREPADDEIVGGVLRRKCLIRQVGLGGRGSDDGWFYETYANAEMGSMIMTECPATSPQRIRFTGATQPVTNSDIRLECLQTIRAGNETGITIGAFCDPAADTCVGGRAPDRETALACDALDRTCGVPCTSTASCVAAGLLGDVCDTRQWSEVIGDLDVSEEDRERRLNELTSLGINVSTPHGFCVNPTCI